MHKSAFDVTRKLILVTGTDDAHLTPDLLELDGCHGVTKRNDHTYFIKYDASQMQFCDVEVVLTSLGIKLNNSFFNRLRVSRYRFEDNNAYQNSISKPRACCNKRPTQP
jgi:hypothetical protein